MLPASSLHDYPVRRRIPVLAIQVAASIPLAFGSAGDAAKAGL